jgi:glutaconate CoA-transferase, subunit B
VTTLSATFSKSEMMIVAAARALAGQRVCFVGVGLPNIAVNLAKRTIAPDLELVYEAGVFGARPARLPLSIGDPTIVTGATAVVSMVELFGYYLQRGLIDVGFLGAAQIDRHGNLNSTVIGDYERPKVRLPGAGGAPEIAAWCRETFVMLRHSPRAFVERLDFLTSVGRPRGTGGAGVTRVITDLGMLEPEAEDGELVLTELHPDVAVEEAQEATGWELRVAAEVRTGFPPTAGELRALRALRPANEDTVRV